MDEIFICQLEAARAIGPALNAVFRDNEKPVTSCRDIEREAAVCGLKPAEVFK